MKLKILVPIAAAAALLVGPSMVLAQTLPVPAAMAASAMLPAVGNDHGMPDGMMGLAGEGPDYTGDPDLQATISLVTAGGAPGSFSIVQALSNLAGADVAKAEVAKLTAQYGSVAVNSFVIVQNYAINDAVKIATDKGIKFPTPTLTGKGLAVRVVSVGLVKNTYYEGTQLDHLVSHPIHEQVMVDIDKAFGTVADANYHKIANQAHYDLAQALGVKTVQLAAFH